MQKRYPFKFLDAYTRADSDFFFGRTDEVEALYEMVFQTDLLLVYGASGTGKTSLIQCGLASKFQSHDWLALNIRRGGDLNASFEKALHDAGGTSTDPDPEQLDWLDDDLSSDSPVPAAAKSLSPLARRFKAIYLKHFKPLYLIFDQFEELYILGNESEQKQFIQTVREILLVEQPVKIILSIREEYLGQLYTFERAVPELLRKKLRVEPMNLDKVKTVIKRVSLQPQSIVRLQAGEEDAIAEGIFEKIRGEEKTLSIQLPYLQVFLDKFYLQITGDEKREADAVLTQAAMVKMGDIGDVLRNLLDEQVLLTAQKLDQKPETIWRILSPFVTLEGTKEPLSEQALYGRLPDIDPLIIGNTLQAFMSSRILRYTEQEQRYEIAHDSLAKQIHAKRSDDEIAILEVQRLIKSQTALKKEAREYFTEKQLAFIEPYLSKIKLVEEEEDWLNKSRIFEATKKIKQEERKAKELQEAKARADQEAKLREEAEGQKKEAEEGRKRARTLAILAGLVAIVAIGLGVLAFFKQREATVAADQALTIVLPDIDRNIYRLEYDVTFPKCQAAVNLKARRREVEKRIWEIAYFYTEADSAAAAIAFLNLLNPTGLSKGMAGVQAKLRSYLASTVPASYLDSLKERYYPKLILVEGGSFFRDDSVEFQVDRFYISKTEITYWQFNVFARAKKHHIEPPSWEYAGDNPAVFTNWYDAAFYLNWLSDRKGKRQVYKMTNPQEGNYSIDNDVEINAKAKGYRLPTEAEWEFAARGGRRSKGYEYSGGPELKDVGWYAENSNSRTHPGGQKKANELGLYDMSGNVWEWCQDWYADEYPANLNKNYSGPEEGSYRVMRGGSWNDNAGYCRTADRGNRDPDYRNDLIGFRLVFVP